MSFSWITILRGVWACCCTVAALLTMIWQCYNFSKGKENTIIEYKTFNEKMETDVYPSISLCWTLPINNDNLRRYRKRFTPSSYAYFLAGFHWDKDMLTIDYDNVTPHFEDYINQYGYRETYSQYDSHSLYAREKGVRLL